MIPVVLEPFSPCPGYTVAFSFERADRIWSLAWTVTGPLDRIVIPAPAGAPGGGSREPGTRRDRLWEHTCFEAFIGIDGSPAYHELNFSPCGAWNIYLFDDYRSGMREASLTATPEISFSAGSSSGSPGTAGSFRVTARLTLPLPAGTSDARLGPAAILEHADGFRTFWASSHRGGKPDFHLGSLRSIAA